MREKATRVLEEGLYWHCAWRAAVGNDVTRPGAACAECEKETGGSSGRDTRELRRNVLRTIQMLQRVTLAFSEDEV